MNTDDLHDEEDLAGFEAGLKAISPRKFPESFAECVETECLLSGLAPQSPSRDFQDRINAELLLSDLRLRQPSAGFYDRVIRASSAENKRNILAFPRLWIATGAAAAFAIALAPGLMRGRFAPQESHPPLVASAETIREPMPTEIDSPSESVRLPVVTLPDGRAFRPVIRQRYAPGGYRAMPGGVVMPVSLQAGTGIDYEPVAFE